MTNPRSLNDRLLRELDEAEKRAFVSLAGYKFQMFGYWAAIWVHLNRIGGFGKPSPFKALVDEAKGVRDTYPARTQGELW